MNLDGKSFKFVARLREGYLQMTSRSLFQSQPFCESVNLWSNQENSPGEKTDLTEIMQGLSWIFSHQRKVLALIMAGKKTKTKRLKIVYFPTSIRRTSQMNALEDFFFFSFQTALTFSQSYVGLFLAQKLDLLLPPLTLSLNSNTIWQQQTAQNKSKIIQQHTQLRTFKTSWQMFGVTPDSHSCLP